ncbi:FAD-dependent oxidoreductase [Paenibacillus sp. A3]|uniref:FAD-dependent oxidoreductase n=1 Tax=Paenibacillus sp. A3 TaxID=1337054 RepID=UPI000A9DC468
MVVDIVIIGAGPAGASAGIFTGRAGKKTVLLDNDRSGTSKAWVGNHYAVMGVTGFDLYETGKLQAQKCGAQLVTAEAIAIEPTDTGFCVVTEEEVYETPYVLIASGPGRELAEQAGVELKSGEGRSYIKVDPEGRTNVPGIWAAGLCTGVSMHVAVTAGDGARVAIHMLSEMNGKPYVDHDMMC